MSRDVTIQDGARKAGVTIATVSRVPNRSSNVASDPHTRVLENLFGELSTACDFVDLVQNGFFTPPVVPLQGSFGHRSALRPLCLGYVSIRQTGSNAD